LSITRQCQLVGLSRASRYYEPGGEGETNFRLMRLIDEQYTRTPFYGVPRMTAWLRRQGEQVNEKRVRRLMRKMGIAAVYQKPRLSEPAPGHRIYPYLLRNVPITRVNQVWSTDITYVRMNPGFVYLVAVMDWFSRYVLAWEVSITMESNFCISALDWALRIGRPEIFNSDQGSQFTSLEFTGRLLEHDIQISMDGRGRALDNVFVERLWRSVKYEDVYLKEYQTVPAVLQGLAAYFEFYNYERLHQALEYKTPAEIFRKGK
jgi:putative transposase